MENHNSGATQLGSRKTREPQNSGAAKLGSRKTREPQKLSSLKMATATWNSHGLRATVPAIQLDKQPGLKVARWTHPVRYQGPRALTSARAGVELRSLI